MADRCHEAAPSVDESSVEQLEKLLEHLEEQRMIALKLINEKNAMDQVSDEAKLLETETDTIPIVQDDTQEEIPERVIIAFVKALEEAHCFFDLKQYLREHKDFKELDYGSPSIFQFLVDKVESDNIFQNDGETIWKAVRDHINEVRANTYRKRFTAHAEKRAQQKLRDMFGESDEYTITQREAVYTRFPGLRYVEPPSMDLSNPVVKLVHETREKTPVYDMDEDPQVELRKIKKSNPMYFHTKFIYQQPPVKLLTKFIYQQPPVKLLKSPSIDGKPVMITIPQSAPNRLKPEDIKAPSANEALLKYRELRVQHKGKANAAEVVSGGNCAEKTGATNQTARGGEIVYQKQSSAGLEDFSGEKYTGITPVKGGNMAEKKQSNGVKYVGISAIYAVPNGFRKPGGEMPKGKKSSVKGGNMPEKKQSSNGKDVSGVQYMGIAAVKGGMPKGKDGISSTICAVPKG